MSKDKLPPAITESESSINHRVAKAIGLKDVANIGPSAMWDPDKRRIRIIAGSAIHVMRNTMGLESKYPLVFDIFNSDEDLSRAEQVLGIKRTPRSQRVREVIDAASKQTT